MTKGKFNSWNADHEDGGSIPMWIAGAQKDGKKEWPGGQK